jgi:DNA replication protein DnaC
MEACRHKIRTRFITGCGLANELIEARDEKLLGRAVKRYASYGLLIIDELGYVPFSKEGAQLIFRVLSASVRWAKNFLKRAVRGRVPGFLASTLPCRIEAR